MTDLNTVQLKALKSDGVPKKWEDQGLSFILKGNVFYLCPDVRELQAMVTITSGHFDNLKLEREGLRYLVTRQGWADGEKMKVTIETEEERYTKGKVWWTTLTQYGDIEPGEELNEDGEWTKDVSVVVTCSSCRSLVPECYSYSGKCERCSILKKAV